MNRPRKNRPNRRTKTRSARKLLLFRVLAVLLPLVVIESAARVYWSLFIYSLPSEQTIQLDLAWENDTESDLPPYILRPNDFFHVQGTPTRTNNLGLRNDENIDLAVPYEGVRIVCVGDSVTFGYTASSNATTYPAVLQNRLRAQGVSCQVVNAGMPGYSVRHMSVFFQKYLAPLKPDIVVVLGGWNDANNSVLFAPKPNALLSFVNRNVYAVRVARHYIKVSSGEPTEAVIHPEGIDKLAASLTELSELAAQDGAVVVLCTLPHFFARLDTDAAKDKARSFAPSGTSAQHRQIAELMNLRIQAIGQRLDIPIVDLARVNDPDLFSDAVHPNDRGSALIAEIVADSLAEKVGSRLTRH